MALSAKDRKRLVQFLGMLGSDHQDRGNAAKMADDLRKANNLTWEELIDGDATLRAQLLDLQTQFRTWSTQVIEERKSWKIQNDGLQSLYNSERKQTETLKKQVADLKRRKPKGDSMEHKHWPGPDLAKLQQELAEAKAHIVRLTTAMDPWHAKIEAWLAKRPRVDRHASHEILQGAVKLPPEQLSTDIGRRLRTIMERIGGWRHSTNIVDSQGNRTRGYIRE